MRVLILPLLILASGYATAQLHIYGAGDPAAAALAHLGGENVLLTGAFSQTIDPQQVGVFSDSTLSIGLDSGLVISTGLCYGVMGPNNMPNMTLGGGFAVYDPDLTSMSLPYPPSLFDPGVIQLDLIPEGDTLEITYVFGSEEYDEYTCSDKDDRMAFFLSGPGVSGPFSNGATNIATLPATGLPVTVNTVNRGMAGSQGALGLCNINPDWLADTIYYINNDFGLGTQLDAYTVVLTARAVVVPGASYHLKIAIVDATDGNFDSALFLPEGAIRCTGFSTSLPALPDVAPSAFWYDAQDGRLYVSDPLLTTAPLLLEAFDATGRLLMRGTVTSSGALRSTQLDASLHGFVLLRAIQNGRTISGRLLVP